MEFRNILLLGLAVTGIVQPDAVDQLGLGLQNLKTVKPSRHVYTPVYVARKEFTYHHTLKDFEGVKIFVTRGDMFAQGAQVIVNAANLGLHGGAGVDAAVENATKIYSGNPNILTDWPTGKPDNWVVGKAFLNTSNAMRIAFDHTTKKLVDKKTADNDINVNVMEVIQAVAPHCPREQLEKENDLKNVFFNSLKVAGDNHKISIALPFLGGGIFGCGSLEGAAQAIEGIMEYVTNNPQSSLREIHCVLIDGNLYPLFLDAFQLFFSYNN